MENQFVLRSKSTEPTEFLLKNPASNTAPVGSQAHVMAGKYHPIHHPHFCFRFDCPTVLYPFTISGIWAWESNQPGSKYWFCHSVALQRCVATRPPPSLAWSVTQ